MVIGKMMELANKRMLGFDLEMLADTYRDMWVDYFHTKENRTLNSCVQMYIVGLAMDKYDNHRGEDMRAGAAMFASEMGHSPDEFQKEIEKELTKGK